MKKTMSLLICLILVLVALLWGLSVPTQAEQTLQPYITTENTTPEELLAAWESGQYSYIKLGADLTLTLDGQDLVLDLAGFDLNLKGRGKVSGYDTANDTYDHLACGILTAEPGITCQATFIAPNGNRYVSLMDGSYSTFHRMDMQIKTVTLRTSAAGLYYKAQYTCDRQVEEKVSSYGIVVSLQDVPGADFKSTEGDAHIRSALTVSSAAMWLHPVQLSTS